MPPATQMRNICSRLPRPGFLQSHTTGTAGKRSVTAPSNQGRNMLAPGGGAAGKLVDPAGPMTTYIETSQTRWV